MEAFAYVFMSLLIEAARATVWCLVFSAFVAMLYWVARHVE
jgi:hypothetical protein